MSIFESQYQIKTPEGAFNPSICDFEGKRLIAYRTDFDLGDITYRHSARLAGVPWQRPTIWLADLKPDLSIENPVQILDFAEDPRLWIHGGILHCSHTVSPRPDDPVLKCKMGNSRISSDHRLISFWDYPYAAPGSRFRDEGTEKNWQFFECHYESYAVYSMNPYVAQFTVLRFPGLCRKFKDTYTSNSYPKKAKLDWKLKFPSCSTPPIKVGDSFWGFFHSWTRKRIYPGGRLRHIRKFYTVGAYRFSAGPPFILEAYTPEPILEASGPRKLIYFPCGAVYKDGLWHLSYGVNDDQCWIGTIRHDNLAAAMEEIT